MTVGDSHGDTVFFCGMKHECAEFSQMRMDNGILGMICEKCVQVTKIPVEIPGVNGRNSVDFAAHCLYFIFERTAFKAVYKKIKLDFAAVDVAVIIHEHGFDTAEACHDGRDLKDPKWLGHSPFLLS